MWFRAFGDTGITINTAITHERIDTTWQDWRDQQDNNYKQKSSCFLVIKTCVCGNTTNPKFVNPENPVDHCLRDDSQAGCLNRKISAPQRCKLLQKPVRQTNCRNAVVPSKSEINIMSLDSAQRCWQKPARLRNAPNGRHSVWSPPGRVERFVSAAHVAPGKCNPTFHRQ